MSYRGRWVEPSSSRELRDEYRKLRKELRSARTGKSRREEIESRLDAIASPLNQGPLPKPPEPTKSTSEFRSPAPPSFKPPAAGEKEKYPLVLTPEEVVKVGAMSPGEARRAWWKTIQGPWDGGYGHVAQKAALLHWRFEPICRGQKAETFDEYFKIDRAAFIEEEELRTAYRNAPSEEERKRLLARYFGHTPVSKEP